MSAFGCIHMQINVAKIITILDLEGPLPAPHRAIVIAIL